MIKNYPDGSSYAHLETLKEGFTFRINSYEEFWHLAQMVDVYHYHGVRPTVTIPNLLDAQADRRFGLYESYGLKLVCKFLNSLEADFKIFHPHNPEVVGALIDNVEVIDNFEFVCRVFDSLGQYEYIHKVKHLLNESNLILMSSDAGGFKPLIKLCDQLDWKGETYSASKARTKEGMKQHIGREDFGGKDILIVDDICVYGGTFKGLSKLLRERNCGKLYLAVSHMTVQDLGEDSVTGYFDKVFTTNSKFDSYVEGYREPRIPVRETTNLEIIKLF